MKTVGIVGITAEGASECYKKIVKLSSNQLGPNEHPEIILVNPSFNSILVAQKERDWKRVANIVVDAAQKCVEAGANFIIVPANSVHFAYDDIAKRLSVPVINIVDVVVDACKAQSFKKVSVLGVGLTMSDGLYDDALRRNDIKQVRLMEQEATELDGIIYNQLVKGIIEGKGVEKIVAICNRLTRDGCEGLVLACTELQMVLNDKNAPLPILDSTELLAARAVAAALDISR